MTRQDRTDLEIHEIRREVVLAHHWLHRRLGDMRGEARVTFGPLSGEHLGLRAFSGSAVQHPVHGLDAEQMQTDAAVKRELSTVT